MSQDTPNSTSSNPMDQSIRYKEIIELGKLLLKELELDNSNDTLGRWMSHHLAELINSAENETGEQQALKRKDCADLILKLWSHKNSLPTRRKPLQSFDEIIDAIAILRGDVPYYFHFQQDEDKPVDNENIKLYLELAKKIDETAKTLVNICVENAISYAAKDEQEWLKTACSALPANNKELITIRVLLDSSENEMDNNSSLKIADELKEFGEICLNVSNELKKSISSL